MASKNTRLKKYVPKHLLAAEKDRKTNPQNSTRMQVIEKFLPLAMSNEQFSVVFQPIVDIVEGEIVSYEALIRWNHPELGMVPPSEFIPIAERMGIIPSIDLWVVRTVLSYDTQNIPVHVNISAIDFSDTGFLSSLQTLLANNKDRIILEFTETAELNFTEENMLAIQAIQALGTKLAIDDFGTGYSSLSFLTNLKVQILKIDLSFVQALNLDIDAATITDAIIRLGNSLNMDVIAEGVENNDQLQHLYRNGCRLIQGYIVSRPVPFEQLANLDLSAVKLAPRDKYLRNNDEFVEKYSNGTLILLELDTHLNFIRITENLSTYLGYQTSELQGTCFYDLVSIEQRDFFRLMFQRVLSGGYVDNAVINLIKKDRSLKSTVISARLIAKGGKSLIVYLEDYTFYKDKLDEMYGIRNAYSVLFHEGPLATIVWNRDFEILEWNAEAEKVFGWKSSDAVGKNIMSLLVAKAQQYEYIPLFEEIVNQDLTEQTNKNIHQNGSSLICRWVNRTLLKESGELLCVISMVTDITENLAMYDNVRLLNAAIEKSGSAVVITNSLGIVEFCNDRFRLLTGYPDGLIGEPVGTVSSHELSTETYAELWNTIRSGSIWTGEFHNIRKDGTTYWCDATIIPITSRLSETDKYICIQNDLTAQKETQIQLAMIRDSMSLQDRMAIIGSMLSGIVHEIKNPLTYIDSNISYIRDTLIKYPITDTKIQASICEALDDVSTGVNHLNELTAAYKLASEGKLETESSVFDMRREIEMMLDVTKNEYKYDMVVEFLPGDPLHIEGFPGQIRQVILNLLTNSFRAIRRKHTPEMGHIEIRLSQTNDYAQVSIVDNGDGISPDVLEHIFEPFFTTAATDGGTGLGLSICKRIVEENHLGKFEVSTQVGAGSTFSFAIPLSQKK